MTWECRNEKKMLDRLWFTTVIRTKLRRFYLLNLRYSILLFSRKNVNRFSLSFNRPKRWSCKITPLNNLDILMFDFISSKVGDLFEIIRQQSERSLKDYNIFLF